jgi:hypothetical protein
VNEFGSVIAFLKLTNPAQDRSGWLKLIKKTPFDINKTQLWTYFASGSAPTRRSNGTLFLLWQK